MLLDGTSGVQNGTSGFLSFRLRCGSSPNVRPGACHPTVLIWVLCSELVRLMKPVCTSLAGVVGLVRWLLHQQDKEQTLRKDNFGADPQRPKLN